MRIIISIFITFSSLLVCKKSFAENPSKLPPSWKAGGKASEEYLHSITRKQRPSEEADFLPHETKARRHSLTAAGSLPDFAHIEYRFSLNSKFAWIIGTSGPMPIKVEVEMPSDIIKADTAKGIAVAYPAFDINFDVTWGPHIYSGIAWHPFGGSWYTSFSAAYRKIRIQGSAATPLRICSIIEAAKEPPCGNDSAAIQTRNAIALRTDSNMQTQALRATTGWIWGFSPHIAGLLEIGVFKPLKSKRSSKATAEILAPDGTPEELGGSLGELRSKSEVDLALKADAELAKYIDRPLPVLGLGLSYRF